MFDRIKIWAEVVCVPPMKAYVGNGGRGPLVLKLGTRGAEWSALCLSCFTCEERSLFPSKD